MKIFDTLVIGAGPAGLTAAIYLRRAGKSVLVMEKDRVGGQLAKTKEIENYPGEGRIEGAKLAEQFEKQAEDFGAELEKGEVTSIDRDEEKDCFVLKTEEGESFYAKTVIVATGKMKKRKGIKGEEDLTGSGVSYCATCDGFFFKDREVAVVGSGYTAFEDAEYLAGLCKKVIIVSEGKFEYADEISSKENVQLIEGFKVNEINGEFAVEGIEIENTDSGKVETIAVNGVFMAMGDLSENPGFSASVEMNEKGDMVADESCETVTEGIFVAGDCRTKKLRQVVTAASDGSVAATAAIKYLGQKK